MDRKLYELTERDLANAAKKMAIRERVMGELESHRDEPRYWKARRTTYRLAKREAAALLLQGQPDWHEGRGQGLLDQIAGLGYTSERCSPAYNAGYYEGYHASVNAMRDYLRTNPNFNQEEK